MRLLKNKEKMHPHVQSGTTHFMLPHSATILPIGREKDFEK